jgi:Tol biopolymer transport system component
VRAAVTFDRSARMARLCATMIFVVLLLAPVGVGADEQGEIAFSAELEEAQVYSVGLDGRGLRMLTFEAAASEEPAESPDTKFLAFASSRSGNWEIYVQPTSGGPARNVTQHRASDYQPAWSPDGRSLVFASRRGGKPSLYRTTVDGTRVTRLTRAKLFDEFPSWSPDGRTIAFSRARDAEHSDVYVVPANGGGARRLTNDRYDNWAPRWSPDGRRIAYTRTDLQPDGDWPSGVVVMNADGRATRVLTRLGGASGSRRDLYASWSPDGKRLAFWRTRSPDSGFWTIRADGSAPRKMFEDTLLSGYGLTWTRSGRLLWSGEEIGTSPILSAGASGGERSAITDGRERDLQPRWSPDATRIAYDRFLGLEGSDEVYVANADGSGARNITNHPASDQQPTWSPDGAWIAFATNRESELVDIYVMRVDGDAVRPLVVGPSNEAQPDWSPDGSRILFTRFPRFTGADVPGDIYSVAANGTDERRLTAHPLDDEQPRWSPDGRTIAFFSERDGRPQLYLMNADGSEQRRLLRSDAADREPSWSPDGRHIVFTRSTPTSVELWVVTRDGTGAHRFATVCAVTYKDSPSEMCLEHAPSPTWRRVPAARD